MLRRLTIFLTVAKHLSYTRAAKELYISQPAVSKHILELEQELVTILFNRRGNSIELTPAGDKAFSYGTDIHRLMQNLKHELAEMNGSLSGTLYLGASSTIAQYLIRPVIARFKEQNSQINISLLSGKTSEINKYLSTDRIEQGITEGDRRLNNFSYTPLLEDEIAFVSGAESTITADDTITIEELKKTPLVIREPGSGTREVFEDALKQWGVKLADLNIAISLGSTESIKSFVLDTEAAGVFSTHAIRKYEQKQFKVTRLRKNVIKRQFSFMTKQGAEHKLAESFIRFCRRSPDASG